jgi:hypothetical protein
MLSRDIGTTLAVFWYIINYTRYRRERLRKFSFRVVAFLVIFKVELGGLVNNIVNATCFPCKKVNIRTQPAIPRRSRIVRSRHIQAQYESYTSTVLQYEDIPSRSSSAFGSRDPEAFHSKYNPTSADDSSRKRPLDSAFSLFSFTRSPRSCPVPTILRRETSLRARAREKSRGLFANLFG